eukprot:GILI01005628.1.p1 GENE.GILI01005628.1~~GILI01005628.1.p1  ORF type:complete len:950 (-),score=322.34 GILI01005628.1:302-3151(-)
MEHYFQRWFLKQGRFCARHPYIVIALGFVFTGLFSLGFLNMTIQSDPQKLWVPPSSRSATEQSYFNEKYGAFFRINQAIFTNKIDPSKSDLLATTKHLTEVYYFQKKVQNTSIEYEGKTYKLDDFCFKPIEGRGCLVTSPMDYFKMDLSRLRQSDMQEYLACSKKDINDPLPCMDTNGVPVMQKVVLGGIKVSPAFAPGEADPDPCGTQNVHANAFMVTYLLLAQTDPVRTAAVMKWEKEVFIKFLDEFNEQNSNLLRVDFMAQRSIEDELMEENMQNAFVIVVSYGAMFVYIAVALGSFPHPIRSRFLLGLAGIVIVIMSLFIAAGVVFMCNVELSLIISEVVPFLVLAIGVDNMFIIAKAVDRADYHNVEDKVARGLAEVGGSITAAAFSEFLAFLVGASTAIPALTSFCLVASFAVLADYILQITVFVACLSLDLKRVDNALLDCVPCVRSSHEQYEGTVFSRFVDKDTVKNFIDTYYIPFLFKPIVKVVVFVVFIVLMVLTIIGFGGLSLGLDQSVTLITDSSTYKYFDSLNAYGAAGPPAYIVLKNVDYESPVTQQAIFDLTNKLSSLSVVEAPVYTWYGSFDKWQNPGDSVIMMGNCEDSPDDLANLNFVQRVRKFLAIKIDSECCKTNSICGEQFLKDIVFGKDEKGREVIETSRLRFQHAPLKVQRDYIQSLAQTRYVVDFYTNKLVPRGAGNSTVHVSHNLGSSDPIIDDLNTSKDRLGFAYSLFYVYYEQYSYIRGVAIQNILLAVGAVFLATQVITTLSAAFIIVLVVAATTLANIGIIWTWNLIPGFMVEINAVSVVNLIMSVGLSVEFIVHIVIAFLKAAGTKEERAKSALSSMGSSVLVGIATTKFLGVLVLAFAPSNLFRLYYFRMYCSIILMGIFHGLIFLPILLSYVGPERQADDKLTHLEEPFLEAPLNSSGYPPAVYQPLREGPEDKRRF